MPHVAPLCFGVLFVAFAIAGAFPVALVQQDDVIITPTRVPLVVNEVNTDCFLQRHHVLYTCESTSTPKPMLMRFRIDCSKSRSLQKMLVRDWHERCGSLLYKKSMPKEGPPTPIPIEPGYVTDFECILWPLPEFENKKTPYHDAWILNGTMRIQAEGIRPGVDGGPNQYNEGEWIETMAVEVWTTECKERVRSAYEWTLNLGNETQPNSPSFVFANPTLSDRQAESGETKLLSKYTSGELTDWPDIRERILRPEYHTPVGILYANVSPRRIAPDLKRQYDSEHHSMKCVWKMKLDFFATPDDTEFFDMELQVFDGQSHGVKKYTIRVPIQVDLTTPITPTESPPPSRLPLAIFGILTLLIIGVVSWFFIRRRNRIREAEMMELQNATAT